MRALLSNAAVCASLFWQCWSNTRRRTVYSNLHLSGPRFLLKGKVIFSRASVGAPFSSIAVSEDLLTEDKKEAKNILASFLEKRGLSSDDDVQSVKKSDLLLDHLVSKFRSFRIAGSFAGQELKTVEIREILLRYLESLAEQYGVSNLVDNVIDPSVKEVNSVSPISPSSLAFVRSKLRAFSIIEKGEVDGNLTPTFLYLLELGMDLKQIKKMVWKYPALISCSLEGKVKPLVEFLLAYGVSKSDIPTILVRWPRLCGCSLKENLLPTVALLESLGVDNSRWAIILHRGACILGLSRQKIESTVNFFLEMGVASENIGKIMERSPCLIVCSVEDKIRPIAEYFRSFGADVATMLHQHPNLFKLSIESNLEHVTRFFLENGFSKEELGFMTSRFGCIYGYSLTRTLVPKWEFFLTMDYPKEALVHCPSFFGYSLEKRIKPRYALVKKYGVQMKLNSLLSLSDLEFETALNRKLNKNVPANASRLSST